ncbi:MAG TPA: Asd/ArgC dimerization domain-containing protein [Thermoanaerobaculia bacterium]|nr:Asd/ArgC dimerization domain-containing protein [Thermoanaerobaculia bacterium]
MSTIAILHPASLVGKELREALDSRMKEWREVRLLSTDPEEVGTLTEVMGAAALVQRYEPDSLKDVSTVYFCGPIEKNRPLFDDVPPGAVVVVLSPDATPEDGSPVVAGVNTEAARAGARLLSPHPALVLLAHVLAPLRSFQPVDMVATLIQPASVQGDPGIQELFEQTREIVAMIGRTATPVYGKQLSFNLLPTASETLPLSDLLQKIVPETPPIPLQVLQGGVFHGLAASLYVRFGGNPNPKAIRKALKANPYIELADDPGHLGPIDSANSDKVILGTVREDAAGGFWFWAVMDNLTRGMALNAVEVAEAVGG